MKKWKFIFWLAAVLFAFDLLSTPFRDDLEFTKFIAVIFSGISLFPLYGYAYNLAIGSKPIAIVIFFINALLVVSGIALVSLSLYAEPNIAGTVIATCVAALFVIYLYPQFMYAFKSDPMWSQNA